MPSLNSKLAELLTGSRERVGFILPGDEIVEVENICEDPENGFDVAGADLLKYAENAIASWHTHPGQSANLSVEDLNAFRCWPQLAHYIIGTDGVRRYVVREGEVLADA